MDEIGLNQQFCKRTLKGVDGCKDQKRREISSMGSAGGFINCDRLPDTSNSNSQVSVISWTDLPTEDFAGLLLERLTLRDYICFGAVCKSWRSMQARVPHTRPSPLPCFIPAKARPVSCFSAFDRRYYARKEFPWSRRIIVCQFGTCRPYIIALLRGCNLPRVTLINPISAHEITLPGSPLSWSDFEEGLRFALSLPPQSSPLYYTVFVIFRCSESKLLFYRNGDRVWTTLKLPWFLDSFNTFRGDLYALRESEEARYLLAVYSTRPTPNFQGFCMDTSQLPSPKTHHFFYHHLVESPNGDELLLVLQIITPEKRGDGFSISTVGFRVFKADLCRKMWIRKETLGDHVLIILDRQSLFLSAASVGHGVKGNCIYFSRLSATGHPLLKMFDLDSETMTDVSIPYASRSAQVMFVPNI